MDLLEATHWESEAENLLAYSLYLSFLTKVVALKSRLYSASCAHYNIYWSRLWF